MNDFVNPKSVKWPLHSPEQLEFDTMLTLACIQSTIPFSMVKSEGSKLLITICALEKTSKVQLH